MDHLPEWKKIKEWYETEHQQTPEIKFRVERISALIESQEKRDKEMNHFR